MKYHGYLFGFENIFILDHLSDSPHTIERLRHFETNGVHVTYLPKESNFQQKGWYIAEEIHRIERQQSFDFIFPLDCDEFLVMRDADGNPTCERSKIFSLLERFIGFPGILEIKENFVHILGHPGYFWAWPHQKVFFTGGNCLSLDQGFHGGVARGSSDTITTSFAHAHFRFKLYHVNRQLSRAKLRPRVDVDDTEALRTYKGPGFHLTPDLLCSKEEYYSKFKINNQAFYFGEIVKLFNLCGIDPNFLAIEKGGTTTPGLAAPHDMESALAVANSGVAAQVSCGNIARGKQAEQSSISNWSFRRSREHDAAGGVDGKPDGTMGFHTDIEDSPWWMVDLGEAFGIAEVRIFNRIDIPGVTARSSRLAIEIGMEPGRVVEMFRRERDEPFGGVDGNPLVFKPRIPIPGRYLRVRLLTRNYLHLDQVEVYGEPMRKLLHER